MAFVMQDSLYGETDLSAVDDKAPGPYSLVGTLSGRKGRISVASQVVDAVDSVLGGATFVYAQASGAITAGQMCQFSMSQDSTTGSPVLAATPWTGAAYSGVQLGIAYSSPASGQWAWFQVFGFSVVNAANSAGITVSGATRVTTTATITTSSAHGLATGQVVTVSGMTPAGYNGTYTITVASSTTFTYVMSADPGANTVLGSYVVIPNANAPVYYQANGIVGPGFVAGKHVYGGQFVTGLGPTIGTGNAAITLPSTQAIIWSGYPVAQGSNL